MEASIEEALRAKEVAEKRFAENDFTSAKHYALKAKTLCPGLEGVSQMVATFEVYIASESRCNGEMDYYAVLGLKPSADKDVVKKQYKKMAVMLHPDKNKNVGADGAFRLVSEAWTMLSDSLKRSSYDIKRKKQLSSCVVQTNFSSVHTTGVTGYSNCSTPPSHDTFWTVCTSCKVQYEYLRKYVNKRLSCKNCRGTFIAVETGTAPVNGSFPYCPWPSTTSNGYRSHGHEGVTYVPTTSTIFTGNGVTGIHTGDGYECVSNVSFQWSSFSGTTGGVVGPNGPPMGAADPFYQANGNVDTARGKVKTGANGKRAMKAAAANIYPNVSADFNGSSGKPDRPDKKRKLIFGTGSWNGCEERGVKPTSEPAMANRSTLVELESKLPSPSELPVRRSSVAPVFDVRNLLIDKGRSEIRKRLEQFMLASTGVVKQNSERQSTEAVEATKQKDFDVNGRLSKPNKTPPMSITVPDPDFHDFDKDRAEECFHPKQIWALYDEDDGMPRLYCLIRQVVSLDPFKVHVTYLNSKTDSEFGLVNWIDSGFTKSCGHFRASNSDTVDQVNVFSHFLKGEKAARGGCIQLYPKRGDIWAFL